MIKRKLVTSMFLTGTLLILSACSKATVTAKNSNTQSTATSHKSSSTSTHQTDFNTYQLHWTNKKQKQLATLMDRFGQNMDQHYDKVTPNSHSRWFNLNLSKYAKDNVAVLVDQNEKPTEWLNEHDRAHRDRLNVVAAYCDESDHILYLFVHGTIDDPNETTVLVSQQRANSDKKLLMKKTENKDLLKNFDAIFNNEKIDYDIIKKDSDQESATNSQADQSTPDSKKDDSNEPRKVNFPAEFQGTWYGNDAYGSELTLTINGAKLSGSNSSDAEEVHDVNQRPESDRMIDDNPSRQNWGAYCGQYNIKGKDWINIKGWFQGAGAGTYYAVANETVNGQTIPVLYSAGGAMVETYAKYYHSKDLADQQKDSDAEWLKSQQE